MSDELRREVEQMSDADKAKLKETVEDQMTKLGEIFSQCWESDEFKQAFIENPKAIFDEYEVNYDDKKEYRILDTPEKTIIHVMPYEGIKAALKTFTDSWMKSVEDIGDEDAKQILLEDWSWKFVQNTEDIVYLAIPLCPEKLSPEELEMVNGGCILIALVFLFEATTVATTCTVAALVIVAAALDAVVAFSTVALVALVAAAAVFEAGIVVNVGAAMHGAAVFSSNQNSAGIALAYGEYEDKD